jgi:glycosyltransferase involved in cell wall biosynthesis
MLLPISLVVLTKNEEANIGLCLASVPFASEKVVLDSGSRDRTLEIARAAGARVFSEQWRGYGRQKARAAELAENDWILSLDADEALSKELAEEIERCFRDGLGFAAYSMPRLSYHLGRWIRHGGWYPDRQIRLYDRRRARWLPSELHEKIETPSLGALRAPIQHWVFKDLTDQIETNNRYSGLGALEMHRRGKRFWLLGLLFRPCSKFFETYVWKRGFLDGLPGFIISVGAAYSMFLRYAKLWELEKTVRTGTSQIDTPQIDAKS